MFKRIFWGLVSVCAFALLAPLFAPTCSNVSAQSMSTQAPRYTYVAHWGVPRAEWDAVAKTRMASSGALDALLADGTITGYGSLEMLVHDDSGVTHSSYWQANSYAGILKTREAILPASAGKDSPYNNAKHFDLLLVSLVYGGKPGASGKGILWVANYELKEGSTEDFVRLFKTAIQPVFEEQIAAGNILGYSLDEPVVHFAGPHIVSIAYVLPDGAALDRFRAAQRAAREKNPLVGDAFDALTVPKGHSDLFATIMFKSK